MVVAFKCARCTQIVESELINRGSSDCETDVHKGLCGVPAAGGDVRIAEVGASLVFASIESGYTADTIVKKSHQILRAESGVQYTALIQVHSVGSVSRRSEEHTSELQSLTHL